jgi:hypothetical protein
MLALAARHCSGAEYPSLVFALVGSTVKMLSSDMYSRREEPLAARHLICITQLLTLPIQEWKSVLKSALSNFDELSTDELLSGARGAGSWLMLRFG